MSQEIKDALMKLDVKDNTQWTSDGSPRVDVLGIPGVKRADILQAAPQFSRENPTVEIGKIDSKGSYLLGTSVQPSTFIFKDGSEKPLGDIVAGAYTTSGLTIDEWNALGEVERDEAIQEFVDTLDIAYEDEQETEKTNEEPKEENLGVQKELAVIELEAATKAKNEAIKVEDAAIKKLDACIDALEKSSGTTTNQEEIMKYIKSQQDLRIKRAARFQQVMAAGIDLNAIGPAPIDKAMSRKNSRGTQRPVRIINDKQDK